MSDATSPIINPEQPTAAPSGQRPVVLITGASSGIGRATALQMLKKGWIVYGAARRMERMQELQGAGMRPLPLDVTKAESRRAVVQHILEETGRIDALVNNAGYGSYGSVEEVSEEEAKRQFEVNVFGAAGMIREVLPSMRLRHQGRIVNITSMGARIYTPMGGWYFASKHALEGLSDALRQEVRSFGIKVAMIEPGVIKSEWSGHSLDSMQAVSGQGPYAHLAAKMRKVMNFSYSDAVCGQPEIIARQVSHALCDAHPRLRYAAPWDAKLFIFMRNYLPECLFDAIVRLICT